MEEPPFPQNIESNAELQEASAPFLLHPRTKGGSQTNFNNVPVALLPGRPFFELETQEVVSHISDELLTPDLDQLAPLLWLVGTQRSDHISPLHHQIVKGRQIIIAEKIELHCTWILDRVFLKPVPAFLMSWVFWQKYLISDNSPIPTNLRDSLRRGALGYLRTYFHLIRYPSDFRLAMEHHLIPEDTTFEKCSQFFARFGERLDEEVSPRYSYGELRLGRLNFWAKFAVHRFAFQKVQMHYGYNAYLTRFYGPLLFIFAFFSVVLSAMQVSMTVNPPNNSVKDPTGWDVFGGVCRWFSILAIILPSLALLTLFTTFLCMIGRETTFALRHLWKNKAKSSGDMHPSKA
ncbi:MAG: hypothetical protein LQ337_002373 [Flavoplaca oasis]|nr:MAG: hypothetical protein LQ337_002373 [Flavoplaca oasis]